MQQRSRERAELLLSRLVTRRFIENSKKGIQICWSSQMNCCKVRARAFGPGMVSPRSYWYRLF